jgi:hypothetical protein
LANSDDKEAARAALDAAGVTPLEGPFLDFRDPWGNRIEIVGYDNVQFTKAPNVLRGMSLTHLTKNESAKRERHGSRARHMSVPRNQRGPPFRIGNTYSRSGDNDATAGTHLNAR